MTDNEDWATWLAVYKDGTTIRQKEFQVGYDELDREKLEEFQMWKDDQLIFAVPFKDGTGSRLIWRRRTQNSPGEGITHLYVIGKRGAFVAVLFPNGVTVLDDNFQEGHAIYGDIDPVKGEEGYTVE